MDNGSSVRRVPCPMESVSTTFQSLDTVRALHQTVVSLRSALEEAKSEIQRLRSQIKTESEIKVGAKFHPHTEKSANITEKRITKTEEKYFSKISTKDDNIIKKQDDHTIIENFKKATPSTVAPPPSAPQPFLTKKKDQIKEEEISKQGLIRFSGEKEQRPTTTTPSSSLFQPLQTFQELRKSEKRSRISILPDISVTAYPTSSSKEDLSSKMASKIDKIDVKIKVLSNIKVDGTRSETIEEHKYHEDVEKGSEGIHIKTTTTDDVEIKRHSPGNYTITTKSKEDIDIEDKCESEGENSVFEDKRTDQGGARGLDKGQDQVEVKEEVDDIELIFSSDENRDPIQEDLVSISEYDPWQAAGGSGTPVLVKFTTLPSDQEQAQKIDKQIKIPISTTCDAFYEMDPISFSHDKSLTSTDSFENQTTTTKSSSLDKENIDNRRDENSTSLGRDESLDFFDNREIGGAGRKWTNYNVLVETDISKCGIIEETSFEMYRRNTCPNPPAYRPMMNRHVPSRFVSRYCRRGQSGSTSSTAQTGSGVGVGGPSTGDKFGGPKRSSSAQTDISALPDFWKSESQLTGHRYHTGGQCTLPSKFVPTPKIGCSKHLRVSERTQEARRVLLSDINFTSMVPELSRSADHLCQDERRQEQINKQVSRYYKGNLLKTPDYALKGITPSASMTSPGVSQWTVNESSFGTQTIQTGESWGKRGDSFDSCRSYSTDSRCSGLDPHHRSRSVPSIRCVICKQAHSGHGIRTSESMHYTPRVTFQEPPCRVRGSLPDLRHDCVCSRRYPSRQNFPVNRDSSGSTESLLDEADTFVRKSMDCSLLVEDNNFTINKRPNLRRMSENDIQKDYIPSKQSLPFLPKTANCLKPGHLAKVISKNGRVVVGRVRYVGPLISQNEKFTTEAKLLPDDLFVGVQLQSKCGDCDGTFEGKKIFDCEPLQGLFVPFKKVVMAWTG